VQKAESVNEFLKRQGDTPQPMGVPGGGAPAPVGGPPGDVMARAGNAISGIESGGKYDALGPETRGDRAYGKYQIMGANVPTWTAEVLGKPMTPQEFLANPQAQDAVFKAKFGQYVQKYGPEGASRAWFAGEGGMNNPNAADVNGMTVAKYGQKFSAGFGGPQVADAGGFTPTNTPAQSVPGGLPQMPPGVEQGGGEGQQPVAAPVDEARTVRERVNQMIPGAQVMGVRNKPVYDAQGRVMVRLPNGQVDALELPKVKEPPPGYRPSATGGLEAIPGGPGEAAANKQNTEQANKLRDDFRSEPPVKAYRIVVPMLESAKDALTRPTRASDINLMYAFAKIMDPESVVRESETGMVTATGTVRDQLQGYIGQLNGNPMLQPETRKRLIAELDSRFKSLEASYQEIEGAYGEIADANGIKRSHVILPIRKPKTAEAPTPGGGVPSISDIDAELQRRAMEKKK
jgi:hypothetical protein